MCTIRARELSAARAVTSTSIAPPPLMAPANTALPGPASTGTDSPVIADRSRLVRPVWMVPSVAARSPGRITMTSPITRSPGATVISLPFRTTEAFGGTSDNRERSPRRVRLTA